MVSIHDVNTCISEILMVPFIINKTYFGLVFFFLCWVSSLLQFKSDSLITFEWQ